MKSCCKKFRTYFSPIIYDYGQVINFGGEGFEIEPLDVDIKYCPFCGKKIDKKPIEEISKKIIRKGREIRNKSGENRKKNIKMWEMKLKNSTSKKERELIKVILATLREG